MSAPKTPRILRPSQDAVTALISVAEKIDPPVAEELRLVRAAAAGATTAGVVVVGEIKRGKSSVVNALMGWRDLSPVGLGVTTTTYLMFSEGEPERAIVHREDGSATDVPTVDVAPWATRTDASVTHVEIRVRAPWLADLLLVDTPGVGGLDALHTTVALEAARQASALLFVTDAGTPFSAHELAFLTEAAERVDTVLFAMTKVDRYRGWHEVMEANERELERVAPRYRGAPWFPIDSTLALDALDDLDGRHPSALGLAEHPGCADALVDWEDSGVERLLDHLQRMAPRARELADLNVARFAHSRLESLELYVRARLGEIVDEPALVAAVAAERARLTELQDHQQMWSSTLELQAFDLQLDVTGEFGRQIAELKAKEGERLRLRARPLNEAGMHALLDEVQGAVTETATAAFDRLASGLSDIATNLFGLLDGPTADSVPWVSRVFELRAPSPLSVVAPFTAQDMLGTPVSGFTIGRVGALALGAIFPGAGAIAGAVVGGVVGAAVPVWRRRVTERGQRGQADLTTQIAAWDVAVREDLARRQAHGKHAITTAFRSAIRAEIARANELIESRDRERKADATEKSALRAPLANHLRTLEKQKQHLEATVLNALGSPPAAKPVTGGQR